MADFRKMLYAFALVALLVGISAPASAQQMDCRYGSVFPSIRAESFTDQVGDITIDCTGGTPVATDQSVPRVNIYVFLTNAVITSKIVSTGFSPAFNEALLLIDDPNRANVNNAQDVFTHPILGCGNNAGGYINLNPGSCDIIAPAGNAADTYDGVTRPNVFQGRQVPGSTNAISFLGVPIDPPGPNVHRYLRVTNIRVNAFALTGGVAGQFGSQIIQASVTTDPSTTIPGNQQPLNVGVIQQGLVSVTGDDAGPWPQCDPENYGGTITLNEGFASAFKIRNWRLMQDNGTFAGGFWNYVGGTTPLLTGVDLNQNVPGTVFNAESAFINAPTLANPTNNPPEGLNSDFGSSNLIVNTPFADVSTNGFSSVGRVSTGTRFMLRIANVPVGSGASVPRVVFLQNSSGNTTGAMVAITGYDAAGAGGTFATTSISLAEGAGPATAVYEVIFSDYTAVEHADIVVTLAPVVDLGANPPVNGSPQIGVQATGTAGFAPFYPGTGIAGTAVPISSTLTGSTAPIPRFGERFLPTPAVNLWSFTKCACDLLFPWVVGDSTFTTSIVVANTSRDPGTNFSFQANPETGRVRFWYYGTAGINVNGDPATVVPAAGFYPSQQTNVLTQPGSYIAHVISPSAAGDTPTNGLTKQPGNFAGYVISQSEFRYCHGVAAISSAIPGFGTQTYIGLVMDNGGLTGDGEGGGGQLPARTTNLGENFRH